MKPSDIPTTKDLKYYVFYKPYNVLTQFSRTAPDQVTLADFLKVDKNVYPVGRLDKDSEGLLVLTNDTKLNSALLSPANGHPRSYFVQLDNDITDQAVQKLCKGVMIKLDKGDYATQPCKVKKLAKAPLVPDRDPPIRVRKEIPTSWALIELAEGKNRQVRKMFAAVGFPVLRLIRIQIENLKIGKLEPGKSTELDQKTLLQALNIDQDLYNRPSKPARKTSIFGRKPRPATGKIFSKPKKETNESKLVASTEKPVISTNHKSTRKEESKKLGSKETTKTTSEKRFNKSSSSKGHAPWQKGKGKR